VVVVVDDDGVLTRMKEVGTPWLDRSMTSGNARQDSRTRASRSWLPSPSGHPGFAGLASD
jgi:hypothetical protein